MSALFAHHTFKPHYSWRVISNEGGLVAVCDQLNATVEGLDETDLAETIAEVEKVAYDDLILNEEETRVVCDALLNPKPPTPELVRLMAEHRRRP